MKTYKDTRLPKGHTVFLNNFRTYEALNKVKKAIAKAEGKQ